MFRRFDYAWRVVATAIAFVTFGLGGLALRLVYFPLLQSLVANPSRCAMLARLTVHRSFGLFVRWMRLLGVLRYHVEGTERLGRPGQLILANHPTLIDVVFLISLVRNADCVVKASLAQNPFTRGPISATGYICNDGGVRLIDDCIDSVHRGNALVIFPEGTRTPLNGQLRLQRGAANIAIRGGYDITPVTITCQPRGLAKGEPWWRIPPHRMHFTIRVLDDIPVAPFLAGANHEPALAARHLTDYLQQFFMTETQTRGSA